MARTKFFSAFATGALTLGALSSGCNIPQDGSEACPCPAAEEVTTTATQCSCPALEPLTESTPTSTLPVVPEVTQNSDQCFEDRFHQPEETVYNSLDLLFVRDTSGSMDNDNREIAESIHAFIGELPTNVDFRIAVMLAHGSQSKYSGRLYNHEKGLDPVFDSTKMPIGSIRAHLKNAMTKRVSDPGSDGELGMYSILKGTRGAELAMNRAQGFFRPEAALGVIFISDENDICAKFPNGKPYFSNSQEMAAYKRDCEGIAPQKAVAQLRALQGDRPLALASITYNNPDTLPLLDDRGMSEESLGYGYLDMISLSNGLSVDLAEGHFNVGLRNFGSMVSKKLQLLSDFNLSQNTIDPSTVQVFVDGVAVPFEFTLEGNQVHLTGELGRAQSAVSINYCSPKAPEPEPDPSITPEPDPSPSPSPTATFIPCDGPSCNGGWLGV